MRILKYITEKKKRKSWIKSQSFQHLTQFISINNNFIDSTSNIIIVPITN